MYVKASKHAQIQEEAVTEEDLHNNYKGFVMTLFFIRSIYRIFL